MTQLLALLVLVLAFTAGRPHRRTLHVAHQSGHWKAHPRQLLAAISYLADHEHAELITVTEVSPEKFRDPLARLARVRGWYVWHPEGPGANECAVLSRHPITRHRARQLTSLRLKFGRTAPTFLVSAHVKGWGWFSVLHTPAHTEGLRDTGKAAWPTKVYRSIIDTLHVAHLQTRHRWTVLGDWNGELRRGKFRTLLEDTFPGLTVINPPNQKPTEGDRVIDGGATSLRIVEPFRTVERDFPMIDHRGVVAVLGKAA